MQGSRRGATIRVPQPERGDPTAGSIGWSERHIAKAPRRTADESAALRVATPARRGKEVVPVTELHVALEVNGEHREVDVEPRRLLVQVIREDLNLAWPSGR